MDTTKIVGQILITVRHIPSMQLLETTVRFEDREDSIYYCWTFKDLRGSTIAAKCLPISKRVIDIDILDHAIKHCKHSIDNYRVDRHKIFEVLDIRTL